MRAAANRSCMPMFRNKSALQPKVKFSLAGIRNQSQLGRETVFELADSTDVRQ